MVIVTTVNFSCFLSCSEENSWALDLLRLFWNKYYLYPFVLFCFCLLKNTINSMFLLGQEYISFGSLRIHGHSGPKVGTDYFLRSFLIKWAFSCFCGRSSIFFFRERIRFSYSVSDLRISTEKCVFGTSLVVQWLKVHPQFQCRQPGFDPWSGN